MLDKFKKHINSHLSFLNKNKILIAISGGLDSVVLTHLCHQLNLNIALAHCNFNLRGKESDADENFVFQLAEDLNIEVFIEDFDTKNYAKENKLSIQMSARELRYFWFDDLAEQLQFDYILTAHHADDNLETFLINLSRGTGIEGLTGIPEINNNIVRPLLPFSRDKIETYAKDNQLKWREDSSNVSTKYLRNKLRHDVIPVLKEINPQLLQNFGRTLGFLQDSNEVLEDRIDDISNTIITKVSEIEVQYSISEIQKLNNLKAYLYQLLKDYGFSEWNDIVDLLNAQSGKQIFSETHRLIKDRDVLILTELCHSERSEESILINNLDNSIKTPFGILFFDEADALFGKRTNLIYVDIEKLKLPLTLRKWKEGDYFYPLGMTGKKKLSKYFKDEKMSLVDKENTWLLCSKNEIIWVINRRADERFKAIKETKQILKIELRN
jgi:tRNA(Ile)-lysidine synthase